MGLNIKIIAPLRDKDTWGEGHYEAPRGERIHIGLDFAAAAGSVLISPVTGHVSKIGYPYWDDLSYRYVEVTDSDKYRHRFFYVEAEVEPGQIVLATVTRLGTVQDVVSRYPVPRGMKNHFHYEIKDTNDITYDPEAFHEHRHTS